MLQSALKCSRVYQSAPECCKVLQWAPECIRALQGGLQSVPAVSSRVLQSAPVSCRVHKSAPECSKVYPWVSECIRALQSAAVVFQGTSEISKVFKRGHIGQSCTPKIGFLGNFLHFFCSKYYSRDWRDQSRQPKSRLAVSSRLVDTLILSRSLALVLVAFFLHVVHSYIKVFLIYTDWYLIFRPYASAYVHTALNWCVRYCTWIWIAPALEKFAHIRSIS